MNRRHAAVLALVGWYLLAPPITHDGGGKYLERSAPLSKWEILRFEDTEHNCQRMRTVLFAFDALHQEQWQAAICIASDDARLK
jgi:hypothetical protein